MPTKRRKVISFSFTNQFVEANGGLNHALDHCWESICTVRKGRLNYPWYGYDYHIVIVDMFTHSNTKEWEYKEICESCIVILLSEPLLLLKDIVKRTMLLPKPNHSIAAE